MANLKFTKLSLFTKRRVGRGDAGERMNVVRTSLVVAIATLGVATSAWTPPFIRMPSPSGTHPVGTTDGVVGGMPITLWYPARLTSGARRAVYASELQIRERTLRQQILFPLVRPGAYLDVPVAAGRHGVVLYVPGWGDKRSDNTALCQDIASHGFVVAAIDDQQPQPAMDFSSAAALDNTLQLANAKVRMQALRLSMLLTALERVNPADRAHLVTSTMDFQRVAAVGFSFGGATAAQAALHDSRIRAAVDLDGWTFGDAARHGVDKPFMIVGDGAATVDSPKSLPPESRLGRFEAELDRQNMQQIFDGFRRYGGFLVSIDGTRHENFADAGLLPFKRRPTGSIDGRRAARIVGAYVNEFLGLVLDARHAPLLTHRSGALAGTSRSTLDRAAALTTWMPVSAALSARNRG
jgi:predicted dienelactone hydrolase